MRAMTVEEVILVLQELPDDAPCYFLPNQYGESDSLAYVDWNPEEERVYFS